MSESGPDPLSGSTFFPKVAPKPATFQPSFPAHQMNGGVDTSTSLPKLGTSSTTTTYLPTLTQAFVKTKPKVSGKTFGIIPQRVFAIHSVELFDPLSTLDFFLLIRFASFWD